MGFFDFLKGILPENLIKIDNRKIEFKDNIIIIGKNKINDKTIINKIFNKISEFKKEESLPFQLLDEDLSDDFIKYEKITKLRKDDLKLLKEMLPQDELECILMARRVELAYTEDKELIKDILKQLHDNYPKKGKKILNLISAGYFDELIIPFAKIFKSQGNSGGFHKFYKELLEFFPIAIFVGNNTTEDSLEKELLKRLKLKNIPFIRIHSVGVNNIKKVENVVIKYKGYEVNDQRYITVTDLQGQIYEINLKDKSKKI